jgi:hypothetical protein
MREITPQLVYARRLQMWRERCAALDRSHLFVSNSRLVVAAGGAVSLWLAFWRNSISPAWSLALGAVFVGLIVWHARVLQRRDRALRAEQWYLRGIERLTGQPGSPTRVQADAIGRAFPVVPARARDGARFLDAHSYARDLDLFGRGSMFELMNTAATEAGEETLADWLRSGMTSAPIQQVIDRQAAVAELRDKIDFREDLAVLSSEAEVSRTGTLAAWALAPPAGLTRLASAVLTICGATMVVLTALVFTERMSSRWLLIWVFLESLVALALWRRIQQVLARVATPDRDLALLSDLLSRIEIEPVAASPLEGIKAALVTDGVPPSRRIAQLRRLVSWLDSTRNQMFAPIAFALLLPQQLAIAIDRWHAAYGPRVVDWLRAIGELEALSAIGTYAYEHPRDPFPTFAETGPVFEAIGLAHPLMREETSVPNDVALGGRSPRVIVLSGSNMSGKSTLLRSVGVNVVLALAGAPVRATRLQLSPLQLGATLRIEDSLQAGHSRFYAEILRIRDIVNLARDASRVSTLFLLDEILHGTNSYDRRIGAEAIVRALAKLGAIGLVTTHDLALTELPATLGPVAVNMHFEDRLEGDTMSFDYRMRPGIVEHSNALALMRAVGLDV